jgi:hypothetical protein
MIMTWLLTSHHAATWALVGLIWVVQLVQYPLFARVGREAFAAYHQHYTRQITWVVAPLMFLEIGTAAWLVIAGSRDSWLLASLVPLAFNWISTGLVQIPLHEKLAAGFDVHTHARLVATNWWRTSAWSLRGFCLFMSCLE